VTARKRRPSQAEYQPGQQLDWTDSSHWDYSGPSPCRYCGQPTQLLDSGRHPAHKTCAEAALAQQHAEAAAAYSGGQTL
jgi:hypothetical protein